MTAPDIPLVVSKATAEMYVTEEAVEDGPFIRCLFEYSMSGADAPLTPAEAETGWRSFTSSEDVTMDFRVGWRLLLWEGLREFAREAWPEDFEDDPAND